MTGRDVMGWMVRHHVAPEPPPDPVAEGTIEHRVLALLAIMQPATVYDLGAAMAQPGRSVIRSAIRRLEEKGLVERDHVKVVWHVDHPVMKSWWRLAGPQHRRRDEHRRCDR